MSALVLVSILSLASSFVNSNFFEKSSGTFSGCSGCCFCFIIYHCLVHLVLFVSLMHEMHKKNEHNEIKTVYVCVYEYGYSLHRLWESTQQRQNQTRYTKACTPKSPCTRNGSNVHIYSGEWTEDKTRRNETKHMKGRRRELEKWTEWKTAEKMS